MISLRAADSPVVDHSIDNEPVSNDVASASLSGSAGGDDTCAESRCDISKGTTSALAAMVAALRTAHGRKYDDLLDVTALLRHPTSNAIGHVTAATTATATSASDRARMHAEHGVPSDHAGAVMMGDDLLRFPRVHALLRRRGVPLIETSAALPHLTIDHETGVLLLDLPTLRRPGLAASMVSQCEVGYRSLWLLVLGSEAKVPPAAAAASGAGNGSGAQNSASAELWSRVRSLLVELCASPLKFHVRVAKPADCWPTLHAIMRERAANPLEDALNAHARTTPHGLAHGEEEGERDESQHEAFLGRCGLNPWAARRISEHYSLRDLLGLSQRLRLAHFRWVPERALRVLGFVADGDDDDELEQPAATMAQAHAPPSAPAPAPVPAPAPASKQRTQALHRPPHQAPPPPQQLSGDTFQVLTVDEMLSLGSTFADTLGAEGVALSAEEPPESLAPTASEFARGAPPLALHQPASSEGDASRMLQLSAFAVDSDGQRQLCWGSHQPADAQPGGGVVTGGAVGDGRSYQDPAIQPHGARVGHGTARIPPPQMPTCQPAGGHSAAARGSGTSRGRGGAVAGAPRRDAGRGRGGGGGHAGRARRSR